MEPSPLARAMAARQSTRPTRAPPLHKTRHALDADARRSMATLLNQRLADATDLYSQTKFAHWNVKGPSFYALHLLFDELAETIETHMDALAERATALGGTAMGTIRQAAATSSLPELQVQDDERAWIEALADRYAKAAKSVGEGIERADESGDEGTADLLTGILRDLDKSLYLLESHLASR